VGKNSRDWEEWKIPLGQRPPGRLRLRFVTDSYSRARDRAWPSWQWALWGQPQLVERVRDGHERILFDFAAHAADARQYVRLDSDGRDRPFDHPGEDSSGATWYLLVDSATSAATTVKCPVPPLSCIAAFTPHCKGLAGLTIAEYAVDLAQKDPR
jgi:hypothetical protein